MMQAVDTALAPKHLDVHVERPRVIRMKRNGRRVWLGVDGRGFEVDCLAAPRARRFVAWVERWHFLAPELALDELVQRSMTCTAVEDDVERTVGFWRGVGGISERAVHERALEDVENAARFRQRVRRTPRFGGRWL